MNCDTNLDLLGRHMTAHQSIRLFREASGTNERSDPRFHRSDLLTDSTVIEKGRNFS